MARRNQHATSTHPLGVVDQVVTAFAGRNRLATALGFCAGGVVPVATYLEAHCDLDATTPLHQQIATYLVLGGLVFSAKSVFAWARLAFRDAWKAAGFVVLLEGVMITSQVPVLPLVLLAFLVAINGIATGCTLSLDRASTVSAAERVEAAGVRSRLAPSPTRPHGRGPRRASPSAEEPETSSGIITVPPRTSTQRKRRAAHVTQGGFAFLESR